MGVRVRLRVRMGVKVRARIRVEVKGKGDSQHIIHPDSPVCSWSVGRAEEEAGRTQAPRPRTLDAYSTALHIVR